MKIEKPKNDWAKTIYILLLNYMAGVSMAKVLTNHEPCFYKFQTRLLEVEKAHPKLKLIRTPKTYKSKMDGKTRSYTQYTLLSVRPYCVNLYLKLNRQGLKP